MANVDSVYAQSNVWDVESNADVQPLSPQMAEIYDQGGIEDDMAGHHKVRIRGHGTLRNEPGDAGRDHPHRQDLL